ncbi:hypothetical protein HPP92_021332 [Vanilla planifolia]|uniref:PROP1-like PPR domain-containing protein n=1 Tax=Vanilla planifolia TaxID=51239 RepID=A0A835UHG4_VANPL|nr:hypothetical protein HPP92_021332 [Vanilla planifolia]
MALKLMNEMLALELAPNEAVCSSIVIALVKEGKLKNAQNLLEEIRADGLMPNGLTYTPLISAYCRKRNFEAALKLHHQMPESGNQALDEMVHHGVLPNEVTYNVMIDGYCRTGDTVRAFKLHDEMVLKGLSTDNYTYRPLITALCGNGRTSEAMEFAEDLVPNTVTYNVLIDGLCKAGFSHKAELLCKEMLVTGFLPNHITYGCFLDHLVVKGKLEEAISLHEVMVKELFANTVTYNILIKGFCKAGRIQDANRLLGDMKSNGLLPDRISYSTLLYGNSKQGDLAEAFKLWEEMLREGIEPDTLAYNFSNIWVYIDRGTEKAFDLLSCMGTPQAISTAGSPGGMSP